MNIQRTVIIAPIVSRLAMTTLHLYLSHFIMLYLINGQRGFANKRLIVVGKFERNVKYHLSMSSKLGFRVPRWKINDTFLRAFVKRLLFFFASHRASAVGNGARDSTSWARRRSVSARGQSVWVAAEGRGRRADLTRQPPTRTHQ